METLGLRIDEREVRAEKGKTVLEAALEAGIFIPNLCHHPDLAPAGACGICAVEIEGRKGMSTACTTPAEEGMVVKTKTPGVMQARRLAAELMLSAHPSDCSTCSKYGQCEFQSIIQFLGVSDARMRKRQNPRGADTGSPLFLHDPGRCVLCGRCVRACHELRGVEVLRYNKKNGEVYVGTAQDLPLADAGCRFCGACVEVCPTGALRDHEGLLRKGGTRKEALIPCSATCPAGIDVPRYIRLIGEGKAAEAAAVIREKVPFPMILGYVCNHRCEAACRRKQVNESLSIRALKRFAAERDDGAWKQKAGKAPPTGRRIAVVGAGPAGLTAAYYLVKKGHSAVVYEELPHPGGMMRWAIPEYRLPSKVVSKEIREIEKAGVEIRTGVKVDSIEPLFAQGFDAVLLAPGAHQGVRLSIPGMDLDGVLIGIDFLKSVRLGKKVDVGTLVLVLGGGNVAFDCARVARRLSAGEVHLACLESSDSMPASEEEIQQAREEGVVIHPSKTFVRIAGEGARVTGVECLDVRSFAFDENGRAQIDAVQGTEELLPADTVIVAVGQRPQDMSGFGMAIGRGSTIPVVEDTLATERQRVFAAGDVVTGTDSVIAAIAAGRKAAVAIDRSLGGSGVIDEALAPLRAPNDWIGREEGFAFLNRFASDCRSAEERACDFGEVERSCDEASALNESRRCLQCDLRTRITQKKFWVDYTQPRKANSGSEA